MTDQSGNSLARSTFCALLLTFCVVAHGQVPASSAPAKEIAPPVASEGLAALAWLEGCWIGLVNEREFREQWTPLRGGLMLGLGHTVLQGRTQNYEYMRLESRPDGIYYVALPSGQRETGFKLAGTTTDREDTIFTFENPANDFPQRIIYRRGINGWLFATIEGKLKGEDRQVIYPMQRIGCESGELIRK